MVEDLKNRVVSCRLAMVYLGRIDQVRSLNGLNPTLDLVWGWQIHSQLTVERATFIYGLPFDELQHLRVPSTLRQTFSYLRV